ncbi:unnamed protein product [Closterium sp. Yama58-4]|nr:unnamed protein product [Closterium sp. Yama58-4]
MGGFEFPPLDGVSNAHDARVAAQDFVSECHSQCLKRGARALTKECTVCLSDFNEMELVRSLPCAHRFHVSCIDHWLADRTTCPVCRVDLSTAAASDVTLVKSVTTERKVKDEIDCLAVRSNVPVCVINDVKVAPPVHDVTRTCVTLTEVQIGRVSRAARSAL